MKILFISADLSHFGGITQYNLNFMKALRNSNEQVLLVERPKGNVWAKILFIFKFFTKVLLYRPNFIISTNINFSPLTLFTKKYFKIPYSLTVYGIEVRNIKKRLHLKGLKEASVIVHLFNQAKRDVIRQLPKTKNNFLHIPNSADPSIFDIKEKSKRLMKKHKIPANSSIILTISRMSKKDGDNKGYERVIKAMPEVLKSIPKSRYILAGSGDDLLRMKKLVKSLGIEKYVIFVNSPTNNELINYYNLADVFITPSKNEGFPPIVFLESLLCGTPIVGGNQPDALMPLWEEELGIIVPSDNVEKISKALINILSGDAPDHLYNKTYLRKRIIEEYGPERHYEHVKDFLIYIKSKNNLAAK